VSSALRRRRRAEPIPVGVPADRLCGLASSPRMPDPWPMLTWLDPDPTRALVDAICLVLGVGLGVWLVPRQARLARQYGGRLVAVGITVIGTLCLLASLQPALVTTNSSVMLLIIGLAIAFRPEAIVRITGGPTPAWAALKAGTELQALLAEWPDREAARRNPGVVEALAALDAARDATTTAYVDAVCETAFSDAAAGGAGLSSAALAAAEARLRRSLWGRPSFERRSAQPTADA